MPKKLKQGDAYAIHHGDFAGQTFIYINESKAELSYNFLSLPDMKPITIPYDTFASGISNNIVEFIEKVPRYVTKVIIKQYKKNANLNR